MSYNASHTRGLLHRKSVLHYITSKPKLVDSDSTKKVLGVRP